MVSSHHPQSQRGIALITAMLVLLLLLSLSLGFALLVSEEQRSNGVDLDHSQAFYAAYGAMEQLNAQLGNLFALKYDPQTADIAPIIATPPTIYGVKFYDPTNGPTFSGYEIYYNKDGNGNPLATTGSITQGQYAGFQGLITNYSIIINAQTQNFAETTDTAGTALTNKYGSEVRLVRTLQTVAIPVFQFGIFSQTDLSFFPGPNFSFGGVVATNGDLYLANGTSGNTTTLTGQTSAYGDVIRDRLSNGFTGGSYQSAYAGTVSITTSPGSSSYRNLAFTEGSINGGPSNDGNNNVAGVVCPVAAGGGTPNANWTTISISDYNSNLRDGAYGCTRGTGAKNLLLPLVSAGATGIDLIKLPPTSENINNCPVFQQRYFTYPLESDCATPAGTNYAMLRIIIADTAQEIMALPGIGPATYTTGCPAPLVQCPVPMSPGTKITPLGVGNGAAKQAIPWAESQGGTTTTGCAVTSSTPPVYGGNCNYGDWFLGGTGATGTDPVNGWSRLGMGDNSGGPPGKGPYIKIEYQDSGTAGWKDVTLQILQLGTTGRNLSQGTGSVAMPLPIGATAAQVASGSGAVCYEPQPDAVIRLQRITDVPSNYKSANPNIDLCGYGPSAANKYALLSGGVTAMSPDPRDYIPLMLFDPREGNLRDYPPTFATAPCSTAANNCVELGGVIRYVELDVTNLSRWFTGAIGTKGAPPANTAGYLVYFSDRRGNQPCTPVGNCPSTASANGTRKLGNLGWEDFVNPLSASGTPNSLLDTGEDLQGANMTAPGKPAVHMPLDTYGGATGFVVSTTFPYPPAAGIPTADIVTAAGGGPVTGNQISLGTSGGGSCSSTAKCGTTSPPLGVTMQTGVTIQEARVNPPLFFRRALKLTDASAYTLGNCGTGIPCGLTITSENPVYIEGNYNATGGTCSGSPLVCTYNGTEVPSAVLADAVTLLSQNWNDIQSYDSPYDVSSTSKRLAVTTYYRTAILAGKGLSFAVSAVVNPPSPYTTPQDFGTDGGVHNFLRYIENWGQNNANLAYNGSIVSFYFNEQAVGLYKCCNTVYSPPGRGYAFDNNFLTPSLLPPRTPTFRDINTLGFTQLILPGQLY